MHSVAREADRLHRLDLELLAGMITEKVGKMIGAK